MDLAWEHGDAVTRLTPELETAIYRVVQEALTNVVKHADAEHAEVTVLEQGDCVLVTVVDDGVGFDQEASHTGFGLTGMRERVNLGGWRDRDLERSSRHHPERAFPDPADGRSRRSCGWLLTKKRGKC